MQIQSNPVPCGGHLVQFDPKKIALGDTLQIGGLALTVADIRYQDRGLLLLLKGHSVVLIKRDGPTRMVLHEDPRIRAHLSEG